MFWNKWKQEREEKKAAEDLEQKERWRRFLEPEPIDEKLEAAIDEVGRALVFQIAANHGWGAGSTPPKYCWCAFVEEARQELKNSQSFQTPSSRYQN